MTDQTWVTMMVEIPAEDTRMLLGYLQMLGFRDIDWCEMQRPDFARVSWGPSEPRTTTGYEIPSEGRA